VGLLQPEIAALEEYFNFEFDDTQSAALSAQLGTTIGGG
jgi:hypothetical protein